MVAVAPTGRLRRRIRVATSGREFVRRRAAAARRRSEVADGNRESGRSDGAAEWNRLCRMLGGRRMVVSSPAVRTLWTRRLLRLVAFPARKQARNERGAPCGPELRAGRGLVLGLRA